MEVSGRDEGRWSCPAREGLQVWCENHDSDCQSLPSRRCSPGHEKVYKSSLKTWRRDVLIGEGRGEMVSESERRS